jgi:Fe-S-cluster containining protein
MSASTSSNSNIGALKKNSQSEFMECRAGCGACCIALSISSVIPGMPNGKAAGVRCVQLDDDNRCKIFGQPERPRVCSDFQAEPQFCGDTREQALELMHWLENATQVEKAAP